MAALIGSIFARLQADASGLDSGLRLAGSKVSLFEKTFAGSLSRVDRRWSKTSSLIGGGAMAVAAKASAMILPLLTAGAAVNRITGELQRYGEINDQAAAAGIDAEFFQGLAFNAKLAGIETAAVAGSLSTFAKNAGQSSAEYGRLLTALQKLAPEFVAQLQAARSQEERIRAVADAIAAQTDASRQAAIATAAFGGEGAKLVAILKGGAVAVDEMVASAKSIGVVVDRDMIARADEWGDRLDTANTIINTKINRSLVQLAPLMVTIGGLTADWLGQLAIVADHFQAIENRQFLRPLQNELAATYNAMQPVKDRIAEIEAALAGGGPNGMILRLDLEDAKGELAGLTTQANALLSRIQELQGYKPPGTAPAAPAAPNPNLLGDAGLGLALDPIVTDSGGGGNSSRTEAVAATVRQAEALADLLADLDFERELIGKSATEQRALTATREAGVSATSAEGQAIRAKITAIDAETEAVTRLTEEMDFYRGLTRSALLDIGADLRQGVGLWDALGNAAYNALSAISDKALSMAADGIFDLIFGSLFGGGFSMGGLVGGNNPSTGLPALYDKGGYTGIGGKYQPAGIVHKGEYVFDAESVRRIGVNNLERIRGYADGGYVGGPNVAAINDNHAPSSVTLAPVYQIDAKGSALTEGRLRAILAENNARLKRDLPSMLADARKRGAA